MDEHEQNRAPTEVLASAEAMDRIEAERPPQTAECNLEVAGGHFPVTVRPEIQAALEMIALLRARVAITQASDQTEPTPPGSNSRSAESLAPELVEAIHLPLIADWRRLRTQSADGGEVRRFLKAGLTLSLEKKGHIDQLIRGVASEPPATLRQLAEELSSLAAVTRAYVDGTNGDLVSHFVGEELSAEVARSLLSLIGQALTFRFKECHSTLHRLQRVARCHRDLKRGVRRPDDRCFSNLLYRRVQQLPGVGLDAEVPGLRRRLGQQERRREKVALDTAAQQFAKRYTWQEFKQVADSVLHAEFLKIDARLRKREAETMSSAERLRASTLWARELLLIRSLYLISNGQSEAAELLTSYLAALADPKPVSTQEPSADPIIPTESSNRAMLESAEEQLALDSSLTVAELDALYAQLPDLISAQLLGRVAQGHERLGEPGWYSLWLIQLEQDVRTSLEALGFSMTEASQLLEAVVSQAKSKDAKDQLRAQAPRSSDALRRRVSWLRHLSQARGHYDSQTFVGEAQRYFSSFPEAEATFRRHIQAVLEARYLGATQRQSTGFAPERLTDFLRDPDQPKPGLQNDLSSLHQDTSSIRGATMDGVDLKIAVGKEKEATLSGVCGIIYSDRLNPTSAPEEESGKFKRLLAENRVTLDALDPTERYSSAQWQESVLLHCKQSIPEKLRREVGAPERIVRKMFKHLTGSREREFYGYVGDAYNFHPRRGRYYIVLRSIPTDDGKLLVWKVALASEEYRRTRR